MKIYNTNSESNNMIIEMYNKILKTCNIHVNT